MAQNHDLEESPLQDGTEALGARAMIDDDAEDEWDPDLADDEDEDSDDEHWMSETGWRQTGAAAAGLIFGLALGAGLALLFAPQTGDETREMIGERAREWRGRAGDRFDGMRDDLGRYARRGKTRMGRGVTRGRWAAQDMLYRAGW